MGDRRDHYEALQDITSLFRVIVEERKRREIDPTLALLRECAAESDSQASEHATARIKSTLEFLEMLNKWYEDMKHLPYPLLLSLLRMGSRVQRFLKKAA